MLTSLTVEVNVLNKPTEGHSSLKVNSTANRTANSTSRDFSQEGTIGVMDEPKQQEQSSSSTVKAPKKPLRPGVNNYGQRYSNAQRVHVIVLKSEGFSSQDIEGRTGIPPRTQHNIWITAWKRGFNPNIDRRVLECHVEEGKQTGRPRNVPRELQQTQRQPDLDVTKNSEETPPTNSVRPSA